LILKTKAKKICLFPINVDFLNYIHGLDYLPTILIAKEFIFPTFDFDYLESSLAQVPEFLHSIVSPSQKKCREKIHFQIPKLDAKFMAARKLVGGIPTTFNWAKPAHNWPYIVKLVA
jgi:hypothetical protein